MLDVRLGANETSPSLMGALVPTNSSRTAVTSRQVIVPAPTLTAASMGPASESNRTGAPFRAYRREAIETKPMAGTCRFSVVVARFVVSAWSKAVTSVAPPAQQLAKTPAPLMLPRSVF